MTGREDCRVPLDSLPMESQLAAQAWEQTPFWHNDDAIAWIASPDAARAHRLAAYRHFMGCPREPHLGLVGRSVASVARAEVSPDEWSRANAMLHETLMAGAVVAYGRSGDNPHGPNPASSWIEPTRLEYGASDHLVDRDGRVRFSSVGIARDGLFAIAATTTLVADVAFDRVEVSSTYPCAPESLRDFVRVCVGDNLPWTRAYDERLKSAGRFANVSRVRFQQEYAKLVPNPKPG